MGLVEAELLYEIAQNIKDLRYNFWAQNLTYTDTQRAQAHYDAMGMNEILI